MAHSSTRASASPPLLYPLGRCMPDTWPRPPCSPRAAPGPPPARPAPPRAEAPPPPPAHPARLTARAARNAEQGARPTVCQTLVMTGLGQTPGSAPHCLTVSVECAPLPCRYLPASRTPLRWNTREARHERIPGRSRSGDTQTTRRAVAAHAGTRTEPPTRPSNVASGRPRSLGVHAPGRGAMAIG